MANIRNPKFELRVNNPDAITDIDILDTIQSQYAASPRLLALLVAKAALADPGKDLMLWYMGIFNPKTAQGVGLDIWGRIVGVPRTIDVEDKRWFGFKQGRLEPFDQGVFWKGEKAYTAYDMNDEAYRTLIFWKAAANIASAEAPALNLLLKRLFPDKTCYVIELAPMHIRVVTRVGLSPVHEAIFRKYGLMAKGAGVGVSWLDVPGDVLGFAGTGLAPFNQAPFFSGGVINDFNPAVQAGG